MRRDYYYDPPLTNAAQSSASASPNRLGTIRVPAARLPPELPAASALAAAAIRLVGGLAASGAPSSDPAAVPAACAPSAIPAAAAAVCAARSRHSSACGSPVVGRGSP
jgi:hypothetical protein